jgi:hypothetical protein
VDSCLLETIHPRFIPDSSAARINNGGAGPKRREVRPESYAPTRLVNNYGPFMGG